MKMISKLSLLAISLALGGCNEKVSPELEKGDAVGSGTGSGTTSGSGGGSSSSSKFSFKIVDTSGDDYNFKLHKTGSTSKCEITSNEKMSHTTFVSGTGTNPNRDITCYLEAEELALNMNGFSVKMEASPDTCEAISYSPYSYYNRQPGDSSGSYNQITCTNEDTTNAHVLATVPAGEIASANGNIGCDQWVSKNIPDTHRKPFTVDEDGTLKSEAELCRFNYSSGDNEMCDIGTIVVYEHQVTWDRAKAIEFYTPQATSIALTNHSFITNHPYFTDSSDDDLDGPDDGLPTLSADEEAAIRSTAEFDIAFQNALTSLLPLFPATTKVVKREIKCGGAIANCVGGAITHHRDQLSGVRGSLYTYGSKEKSVEAEFSYPSLFPKKENYVYANFRRNLANDFIAYLGLNTSNTILSPDYAPAFNGVTSFDPQVLQRYTRNRKLLGLVGPATDEIIPDLTPYSIENDTFTAKPLAAEPFLGINFSSNGKIKSTEINPFYTFECLDAAREPKARIRLMVREWDRFFAPNQNFTLISDIGMGTAARMDRDWDEVQDGGYWGDWEAWNDWRDWDDIIPMNRSIVGGYLIYEPRKGFFHKDNFPNASEND
jgi:hypothetical protein